MKKLLTLCTLAIVATTVFAQDDGTVRPSAASQKYGQYRHQSTEPLYSVSKVKALIAKIKTDQDENRTMAAKTFNALTLKERFTYVLLHGEDFSQNCDAMPEIMNEQTKIFAYFPSPFGDEATWSDKQRAFLDNNRTKVVSMLKENIDARQRVGVNFKRAITYVKAYELIPDLTAIYKRDRKDRDLLSVMMQLMQDGKYKPFTSSSSSKKLYGDDSNYHSFISFNAANEKMILGLAAEYYKSKKK